MVVCVSLVLMIKDKEKKEISPEKSSNYLRMFARKKKTMMVYLVLFAERVHTG